MERFVDMLQRVQHTLNGTLPMLRLDTDIMGIELAEHYPVARWLNDELNVQKDRRVWFQALATRTPLFPKAAEIVAEISLEDRADCLHNQRKAHAFSAARLLDGLTVSFLSDDVWNAAWLPITIHTLDAAANVNETAEDIRHASRMEHIDTHADWLHEISRISVKDGRDLWDKRRILFPALDWCKDVRTQLADFRSGDLALRQIVKRLREIQRFFADWDGSPLSPSSAPTKCTRESESTMRTYRKEHTFVRENGQEVEVSWHIRFTPGSGRIFFEGDQNTKKGIVGCIARNGLPTVSDPT